MASLSNVYIKLEKLKEIVKVLEHKGDQGIELTISLSDEMNKYDQNTSVFVAQTKEQREQQKPKYYLGNGRTFWSSDNSHPKAAKKVEAEVVSDGLPF